MRFDPLRGIRREFKELQRRIKPKPLELYRTEIESVRDILSQRGIGSLLITGCEVQDGRHVCVHLKNGGKTVIDFKDMESFHLEPPSEIAMACIERFIMKKPEESPQRRPSFFGAKA